MRGRLGFSYYAYAHVIASSLTKAHGAGSCVAHRTSRCDSHRLALLRPAEQQNTQIQHGKRGNWRPSGTARMSSTAPGSAHGSDDNKGVVPPSRRRGSQRTSRDCSLKLGLPPRKPPGTRPRQRLHPARPIRSPWQRRERLGAPRAEEEPGRPWHVQQGAQQPGRPPQQPWLPPKE